MRTQPPGPTGPPVFGSIRRYSRDPFSFLSNVGESYGGRLVRFDLGPLDTYMATDPAHVEQVLVSDDEKYRKPSFQDDAVGELLGEGLLLSEGEQWRRQRDLARPAFDVGRIQSLDGAMTDRATSMVDGWTAGETVDVHREMAHVTVEIIADAMFGTDLSDETVRTVQENLEPLGARFEPDPFRFLVPDWVPTRENREYRASLAALEGILDGVVAERRGTEFEGKPSDLLSILLRAQARGEQSDEQLRDELMTMLLAGHDTTALALTYAWVLLSEHPEAEARLHEELDAVLGGDAPTAADASELAFTERVVQEAMRLYPPVYAIFREPKVDVRLGETRVPEGSAVLLSQWVFHRSPRFWDDPETFDPDRFAPARRRGRPRFAYFPFGGGPRHCIGKQFSMLEAKLILGTVAQRYRLRRESEGSLSLRGSLTMHPEDPVEMRLEAR